MAKKWEVVIFSSTEKVNETEADVDILVQLVRSWLVENGLNERWVAEPHEYEDN